MLLPCSINLWKLRNTVFIEYKSQLSGCCWEWIQSCMLISHRRCLGQYHEENMFHRLYSLHTAANWQLIVPIYLRTQQNLNWRIWSNLWNTELTSYYETRSLFALFVQCVWWFLLFLHLPLSKTLLLCSIVGLHFPRFYGNLSLILFNNLCRQSPR